MEFRAKLPADENRGTDGLQLRVEFMVLHGEFGSSTNRGACTMLEFLIAISRKMSFMMSGNAGGHHTEYYFWKLIVNLGLNKLTDDKWEYLNGEFFCEDAIYRLQNRLFDWDGNGGLFPLRNPKEDQRMVEFWYQMHAYLNENSEIDLTI